MTQSTLDILTYRYTKCTRAVIRALHSSTMLPAKVADRFRTLPAKKCFYQSKWQTYFEFYYYIVRAHIIFAAKNVSFNVCNSDATQLFYLCKKRVCRSFCTFLFCFLKLSLLTLSDPNFLTRQSGGGLLNCIRQGRFPSAIGG